MWPDFSDSWICMFWAPCLDAGLAAGVVPFGALRRYTGSPSKVAYTAQTFSSLLNLKYKRAVYTVLTKNFYTTNTEGILCSETREFTRLANLWSCFEEYQGKKCLFPYSCRNNSWIRLACESRVTGSQYENTLGLIRFVSYRPQL